MVPSTKRPSDHPHVPGRSTRRCNTSMSTTKLCCDQIRSQMPSRVETGGAEFIRDRRSTEWLRRLTDLPQRATVARWAGSTSRSASTVRNAAEVTAEPGSEPVASMTGSLSDAPGGKHSTEASHAEEYDSESISPHPSSTPPPDSSGRAGPPRQRPHSGKGRRALYLVRASGRVNRNPRYGSRCRDLHDWTRHARSIVVGSFRGSAPLGRHKVTR